MVTKTKVPFHYKIKLAITQLLLMFYIRGGRIGILGEMLAFSTAKDRIGPKEKERRTHTFHMAAGFSKHTKTTILFGECFKTRLVSLKQSPKLN